LRGLIFGWSARLVGGVLSALRMPRMNLSSAPGSSLGTSDFLGGFFMARRSGKCVFCGGNGKMSDEHVWSDWLQKIIPKSEFRFESHYGIRTNDGTILPDKVFKRRQGAVHSKKARCVCRKCNNGWMSNIVNAAKPFATKLALGEQITVEPDAQAKLSSWLALWAVAANHIAKTRHKIPRNDIDYIYVNRTPPPHWYIDVGLYREPRIPVLFIEFNDSTSARVIENASSGRRVDSFVVHSMTTIIGHLYVTLYCANPASHPLARIIPPNIHRPHLVPMWPVWYPIPFPPPPILALSGLMIPNGGSARDMAMRLQNHVGSVFAKAGISKG
jgi:hypothetical protein